jgi:hypothetical protein
MISKKSESVKIHRSWLFNPSHLQEVEESYLVHLKFGVWAGFWLIITGVISIVHAVVPVLLARVPDRLFRYIVEQSSTRINRVEDILRKKNLG